MVNLLIKTGVFSLFGTMMVMPCQAKDSWNIDGEHGELHVYGSLIESACRLDMRSAFQDVELKDTSLTSLNKQGDSGKSTTFVLQLLDCQRTRGELTNIRTGTLVWDSIQPVISVTFNGVKDPDDPSLWLMKGVSGADLMINDSKGHQIVPGVPEKPQFVTPTQDQLVYSISSVRTKSPLIAGGFRTIVDFKVNYE